MSSRVYEIFDLLVERQGQGFRARVLSSPAGNAADNLQSTVSEEQLLDFLTKVGRPRFITRGKPIPVADEVKRFGGQLFTFLFPPPIASCLERSRTAAIDRGHGLRIQIRLSDVPELCDLPWEFLHDEELGFFGLTTDTSVVRFLELRQPSPIINVTPPLRILVVISSPADLPSLDASLEYAKLENAVRGLKAKGIVELQKLENAQLSELYRQLRENPCHVLHFVGHGFFDEKTNDGQLYFENEMGRSTPVSAERLSTALRDFRTIQLVVLNACEGARSSRTDPFAGAAQTLVRRGMPAVIAMQFEVSDRAAITFASELYSSIAVGDPLDACVAEARKAINLAGNDFEWATPVLYLRATSGQLFAVQQTPSVLKQQEENTSGMKSSAPHEPGPLRDPPTLSWWARRGIVVGGLSLVAAVFAAWWRESSSTSIAPTTPTPTPPAAAPPLPNTTGAVKPKFTPVGFPGFDCVTAPEDSHLDFIKNTTNLVWCGYYLAPAPSHPRSNWLGRRAALQSKGWGLAPIYVGQQTSGPGSHNTSSAQGTVDGNDAVKLLFGEGFASGTCVYLDLEDSNPLDTSRGQYVSKWVEAVRAANFQAGVYCSHSLADSVHNIASDARIWVFRIDRVACAISGPNFPNNLPDVAGYAGAYVWQLAMDCRLPGGTPAAPIFCDLNSALSRDPGAA